ncbi:hypothetical protein E3U23_04430 [Erythrobacter litoralis]|uniref:peptidoglycan-binding protein n=1 Tax=Erythrobacter litoralis TaxID=39960 RepID=UPI0024353446|nr:peptidoglycan-binding protein [Erythrobacter litoralis]MDG6078437.1 hypothetical protein [Erythrobacter litoralis]
MDSIDRQFFFARIRMRPFGGRLIASQVERCATILDHWERGHAGEDDRWLAYLLSTAYHETAATMAAIDEYGGAAYFERRYGPQTAVGRALGNVEPGDGARFHGRGFVQLTGRANYADWSERTGFDLVSEPDIALYPNVAAQILIDGAILGTFTGKRLGDYLNDTTNDWFGARRVINRLDRAADIAGLGKQFWAAISHEESGQSGQAAHRRTIRIGDRGETVRFLQTQLGLREDGEFGPVTSAAVQLFQVDKGMASDGIVGRITWAELLRR